MKKRCFVIMPFSETTGKHDEAYWTNFFTKFIKVSVEKVGYACSRSKAQPANIIKDVLTELLNADLVLSVLTDYNENVWYELGIRHALRRGTIMIIEEGQKLPFDISQYGVIHYEDSISGASDFEKQLYSYIMRIQNSQDADSPAFEFLEKMTEKDYNQQLQDVEIGYKTKVEKIANLVQKIQNEERPEKELSISEKSINRQVLWVDDCPSNNEAIMEIYRVQGVEFDIASSTTQAIDLLNQKTYDLIISDLNRGSEADAGIRMLREIKRYMSAPPPILVFENIHAIGKREMIARREGAVIVTASVRTLFMKITEILSN